MGGLFFKGELCRASPAKNLAGRVTVKQFVSSLTWMAPESIVFVFTWHKVRT